METQAEAVVTKGITSIERVHPPHPHGINPRSPGIVEVVSQSVESIVRIVAITSGEIVQGRAESLRWSDLAISGMNTVDNIGELPGNINVGAAHSSVAKPVGEAQGEVQVVQQGRLGLRVGLAQNENCQGTQDNLGGELYREV